MSLPCEKCGIDHSKPFWTGRVTLELRTEFNWEVDENWEVETAQQAQDFVEEDVGNMLKEVWSNNGFDEQWTVEEWHES